MQKERIIKKTTREEANRLDDLSQRSAEENLALMWPLALNAWAFQPNFNAESRLQRHVVVLKRGKN